LSVAAEGRWEVELLSGARIGLMRILEEHGDDAFDQALNDILALKEDPTPEDAEPLRKTKDHYRIYIYRSLYRAVYRLLSRKRIVLVERVGPRGSVYLKGGYVRW
jgi:mRNA-degrading endonuclease RelE of RelBE toxin-antitoxin system